MFDLHTRDTKETAKGLRKLGYSYSYISQKLSVSKSTLSLWFGPGPFVPNEYTREVVSNGQKKSVEFKRSDKALSLNIAHRYAEEKAAKMSAGDVFFLGLGIFIGEGTKSTGSLRVVNADPRIMRFMVAWFRSFGLTDKNFRVRIHCYPDTDQKEAVTFWSKELGLSRSHFYDCIVDMRTNKRSRSAGALPYGTAHLSIISAGNKEFGVLLHRKILATIDRALGKRD